MMPNKEVLILVYLLVALCTTEGNSTCYSVESCLYDRLFATYNSEVRPAQNPTSTVDVAITLNVKSLLDLDEKNEVLHTALVVQATWYDYFLSYNTSEFPIDLILVQADTVWLPDFTVTNTVQKYFDSTYTEDFRVYVTNSGQIAWYTGGTYQTSCSMVLTEYPFDTQSCQIILENWAYLESLVNITQGSIDTSEYVEHSLWKVIDHSVERSTVGSGYPRLTFTFSLKRRSSYYVMNLILPCLMVTCAALGVFWLPAECGEKISLSITILLAYVVFQIVIMDQTPTNSQDIPMISKLVMSVMTLTTISVMTALFTAYITYRKSSIRVPNWLRIIAFQGLAKIFFLQSDIPYEKHLECFITDDADFKAEDGISKEKMIPKQQLDTMEAILQQLKSITAYLDQKKGEDFIQEEWRLLALIIDRLCFWITLFLFIVVAIPVIVVKFGT